jgi:hypothetical protein
VIVLGWLWQAAGEFAPIEQRLLRTWLPVKAAAYACLAVGVLMQAGQPRARSSISSSKPTTAG